MSHSTADGLKFIQELELDHNLSSHVGGAPAGLHAFSLGSNRRVEDDSNASVVARSIITYPPGLTPDQKKDVQSSTFLAQLAASAVVKGGLQEDTQKWFDMYSRVLTTVGWIVHDFEINGVPNANQFENASALVLNWSKDYLNPQELKRLQDMINALSKPVNSHPLKVFNRSSLSPGGAGFHLGDATIVEGDPSLALNYFVYKAPSTVDNVLFWSFKNQHITFTAGRQIMRLSTSIYDLYRDAVTKKIKEHIDAISAITT